MTFEWDENKNKSNIEKHGIDFNDAKEVFKDINKKTSPDLRIDYGEDRWIAIGQVVDTIIVVVFTVRNMVYRIISARYAKKKERNDYRNK
ncbi:MAG: BrnT family toxin [Bacteroidetes bacterium]|nr:MAG: BrnT family toxin [Bacteroidota bacterium]RLD78001.1 MAG: BrnT family toxin [Bacteroidota bacterium]